MPGKNHFKQYVYKTSTTTGIKIGSCPPPKGTAQYYYVKRNEDNECYYYSDEETWTSDPQQAKEFTNEHEAIKVVNKLRKQYPGAKPFPTTKSLHNTPYYYYITVQKDKKTYYYGEDKTWKKPEEAPGFVEFIDQQEAENLAQEICKQYLNKGLNVIVEKKDHSLK